MSGTYSQIYLQIVFAVMNRENLIAENWKDDLHKYIAGIIKAKNQKPIIVNGMPDHIHVFVGQSLLWVFQIWFVILRIIQPNL